jgi:hypothetical protein
MKSCEKRERERERERGPERERERERKREGERERKRERNGYLKSSFFFYPPRKRNPSRPMLLGTSERNRGNKSKHVSLSTMFIFYCFCSKPLLN